MIITPNSHVNHIPVVIKEWIEREYKEREGVIREIRDLPPNFPAIKSECHYVPSEKEVFYIKRSGRNTISRMTFLPPYLTRRLVVIGGPAKVDSTILYTTYGGEVIAPREPNDLNIQTEEEYQIALDFWKEHALSYQE